MDSTFLDDLRYAKEIKLEEFEQRSRWSKLVETGVDASCRDCSRPLSGSLADVLAAERGADRFAHGDRALRRATAGESSRTWSSTPSATGNAAPARGRLVVGRLLARLDGRAERGGERRGDAALERVAGDVSHLLLDVSSVTPSRWRILIASSWRKWR